MNISPLSITITHSISYFSGIIPTILLELRPFQRFYGEFPMWLSLTHPFTHPYQSKPIHIHCQQNTVSDICENLGFMVSIIFPFLQSFREVCVLAVFLRILSCICLRVQTRTSVHPILISEVVNIVTILVICRNFGKVLFPKSNSVTILKTEWSLYTFGPVANGGMSFRKRCECYGSVWR